MAAWFAVAAWAASAAGLLDRGVRVEASVDVPLLAAAPDLAKGAGDPAWRRASAAGFFGADGRGPEPAEAATSFRIARTATALIECDIAGERRRFWWAGTVPADGAAVSVLDDAAAAAVKQAPAGEPAGGWARIALFDANDMNVLARQLWRPVRSG